MDIEDSRYQELLAAESERNALKEKVGPLEETAAKVPDLESKVEQEETARKSAEKERDDLKAKVDESEETARRATLSEGRMGELGKDFLGKIGDFTRSRLEEQAGTYTDEEWEGRLKELEEMASVKRGDGGKPDPKNDDTVTADDTARSLVGGGDGGSNNNGDTTRTGEPSDAARGSVVAGLVKRNKS